MGTTLKGITNIGDKGMSEIISDNLITFFDWGFINVGGYIDVNIALSGAYGGNASTLRPVDDPRYTLGQIWGTANKNWLWEENLGIDISGVWVDGNLYPSGTVGAYAHTLDYPNGQVIFSSGLPTTASVQVEHSYKWIDVVNSEDIPFFRRVQRNHNRIDSDQWNQLGSGDFAGLVENRIQLPTVAVEVLPLRRTSPLELGSGARYFHHTVLCHILASTDHYANRIADVLADQKEVNIFLFDSNLVAASSATPLNYLGGLVDNTKTYPNLVKTNPEGGYRSHVLRFAETESTNGQWVGHNVYLNTVRLQTEVIVGKV